MHICLASQNLNKQIKRHNYKLPTREEIMTNFAETKVYSNLDAFQEFYQTKFLLS